jgi:hypothetical protein
MWFRWRQTMTATTHTDDDALTFETPDGSETVTVPETFERGDYDRYYGNVPDEWDVERVFRYDGHLRAEALIGDEWVEAIYYSECDSSVHGGNATGWVVDTVRAGNVHAEGDGPGETLWTAEGDDE